MPRSCSRSSGHTSEETATKPPRQGGAERFRHHLLVRRVRPGMQETHRDGVGFGAGDLGGE